MSLNNGKIPGVYYGTNFKMAVRNIAKMIATKKYCGKCGQELMHKEWRTNCPRCFIRSHIEVSPQRNM
jgi:Zn finger protein HypA/HybF involved in hydrogenase expression